MCCPDSAANPLALRLEGLASSLSAGCARARRVGCPPPTDRSAARLARLADGRRGVLASGAGSDEAMAPDLTTSEPQRCLLLPGFRAEALAGGAPGGMLLGLFAPPV